MLGEVGAARHGHGEGINLEALSSLQVIWQIDDDEMRDPLGSFNFLLSSWFTKYSFLFIQWVWMLFCCEVHPLSLSLVLEEMLASNLFFLEKEEAVVKWKEWHGDTLILSDLF